MHTIISSLSRGLSIKIDLPQKRLKWTERLLFRHSQKKKRKSTKKEQSRIMLLLRLETQLFLLETPKNHIEIVTSAPKMGLSDRSLNQHSSISLLIGGFLMEFKNKVLVHMLIK